MRPNVALSGQLVVKIKMIKLWMFAMFKCDKILMPAWQWLIIMKPRLLYNTIKLLFLFSLFCLTDTKK